jgi:hypothetical protein
MDFDVPYSCMQELKTVHNSSVTVLTAIQAISISGDKEVGENFNISRNTSVEIYQLNNYALISHTQ